MTEPAELSRMIVSLAKESARRSFQAAVNTLIGGGFEEAAAKSACRAALIELAADLVREEQAVEYADIEVDVELCELSVRALNALLLAADLVREEQAVEYADVECDDELRELSMRALNALLQRRTPIRTLRQLREMTKDDLYAVKGIGRTTLMEIVAMLERNGMRLKSREEAEAEWRAKLEDKEP